MFVFLLSLVRGAFRATNIDFNSHFHPLTIFAKKKLHHRGFFIVKSLNICQVVYFRVNVQHIIGSEQTNGLVSI